MFHPLFIIGGFYEINIYFSNVALIALSFVNSIVFAQWQNDPAAIQQAS